LIRAKVIHTWQQLAEHQRKELRRLADRARDTGLRCRCKIILAPVRSSTPTMIVQGGLCAKSQVYRVAERFLSGGLAGLADRREDNGQPKITPAYQAELDWHRGRLPKGNHRWPDLEWHDVGLVETLIGVAIDDVKWPQRRAAGGSLGPLADERVHDLLGGRGSRRPRGRDGRDVCLPAPPGHQVMNALLAGQSGEGVHGVFPAMDRLLQGVGMSIAGDLRGLQPGQSLEPRQDRVGRLGSLSVMTGPAERRHHHRFQPLAERLGLQSSAVP
jgi:hypothetical protein